MSESEFERVEPEDNYAEELDEDTLGYDPVEKGFDPPDKWSEADSYGTTADEQQRGEPLDQRLADEEPDIKAE